MRLIRGLLLLSLVAAPLSAQSAASLSQQTRNFVSVGDPVVALTNATIIDGTGAGPKTGQTVVIKDGKIVEVGPSASVKAPPGAHTIDLTGQTVIPGLVGMHDHLFYTAAGGREASL